MRGHLAIGEARRMNHHPADIWVVVRESEPVEDTYVADPENLLALGMRPEIHLFPNDTLARCDFRCVFGVTVHVNARDPETLRKVVKHVARFKPLRIIASDATTTEATQ